MSVWQLFLDDKFVRSDTSTGSAGTTTGAGNSWTDIQGGVYQIASNALKATADAVDNSQYLRDFLTRPSGENQQDQRVLARTAASSPTSGAVYDLVLRYQSGTKNCYLFSFDIGGNGGGGTIEIFKIIGGAATQIGTTVNVSPTRNISHVYELQCSAVGISPTTLNFSLVDITAGTTVATYAQQTDSAASLQTSGAYGLDIHSNPGGAANMKWSRVRLYQSVTSPNIAPNDGNLFYSPYNWKANGSTYAQSNCAGAYLKAAFSGTELSLAVDVTPLSGASVASGSYPVIRYSVDNAPFTDVQLASGNTVLALGTDLGTSTHTLLLYVLAVDPSVDQWTTPVNLVRLTGLYLDSGAATSAVTQKGATRCLFFGDSISGGAAKGSPGPYIANSDSTIAFPFAVSDALASEYGVVAFGGLGWTITGLGNAVPFYTPSNDTQSSWNKYYSGNSRLVTSALSPTPDHIFVMLGFNDANASATDANVRAAVSGWLTAARAAAATSQIWVIVAVDGSKRSAVTNGYNDYQATPDSKAHLIDMGTDIQTGLAGVASWQARDGVHPTSQVHAEIAARILKAVEAVVATPAAVTRAYGFAG